MPEHTALEAFKKLQIGIVAEEALNWLYSVDVLLSIYVLYVRPWCTLLLYHMRLRLLQRLAYVARFL
jgi:hypothetical protein